MLKEITLHISEIILIISIIIKFYLIIIEKYYELINRNLIQNYFFQIVLLVTLILILRF